MGLALTDIHVDAIRNIMGHLVITSQRPWNFRYGDKHGHYYGCYLDGSDGMRLSISISDYRAHLGKAHIHTGVWPRDDQDVTYGKTLDGIYVSLDRDAETVAKDIYRRLVADYIETYEANLKERDLANTNHAVRRTTLSELTDLIKQPLRDFELRRPCREEASGNHGVNNIRVNSDGTEAKLELRYLPIATVKEVLELLKQRVKGSK